MPVAAHDKQSSFPASPHQHLTLLDSTSIIVGIIIGSSIYCSSPLDRRNRFPMLAGWSECG